MGYRFLDDYNPRKETKKKQQNGALSAPRSGNSLNPFAANNKKPSGAATGGAQTVTAGRTTRGTALGGSAVTPVQIPKLTVPKLTKATTAQKTAPVKAPQQLKLPTIQAFGAGDYTRAGKAMDRAAKTVKAGAVNAAAGAVEIAGQFRPTTGQQSMGQFSGFGDLGRAVRENRTTGTDINESIRRQEQQRRVRQKQSQQNIFAAADRLTEKGQQYEREAKQGLGTVGQFLVDMGVTGTQMAGDALVNLILPGGGLAVMGMRSYGQAAGEARRQGKSEQQQFLAGLKSAGIEVFTEKMFGAFSKVYGGAAADELVEKLVSKMTGNATGQALLTWIINGVGEGVEEVTSDLLNPLADRLLRLDDGKGGIYSTEDLAQWGYDFLLGAAMGIVGGSVQLARGVRQGQAQTAEGRYYDDLRRNGLGSANAAGNARRASAAMGRIMPTGDGAAAVNQLRMPTLTNAQGRTYEQRMAWQQIPETQRAAFDEAQRIAQRFGAQVTVNQQEGVNGSYREGVISLNPNAANPVRQTLIHELTHHMESSGLYREFSRMAMQYVAEDMGADVDSLRHAVAADYAQNGVTLDEDGANREIVAKFAEEKLFTDEATVRRLLAEDRNLFQRIYDWIRDALGKLTGTSEENFLREAEKLYAKALREATAETGRGAQMLFAGVNARTANMQTLARAEAIEADGMAAEDIRRETGWFRGMDGKWRFEIDDSAMQYDRQGVTQNPDVQRKRQLEEKLLYGQLTQDEANELRALTEATRGVPGPRTLGDYLQHDALFEAYPELRDAAVVFEKTEPGVNGYYNARTDTIVLSDKLRGAPENTLVHEIQHVIQRAEEFSRGSTPEYWAARDYETGEITQALEQEYNQVLHGLDSKTRNKYLRYQEVNRMMENLENAEEGTPAAKKYVELENISDRLYTELWGIPEFRRLLDLKRQIDTPKEVYDRFYRNTAGEIEARDAAARRGYNAEQRRQLRPDLGNEATVFAEGNGTAYDINPFHRDAVDQWNQEGRPEGETFILGSTGPVLQGLGAIESDIYMQGDKINRILQDHPEMTLEEIKRLPEILEDPVLVLKSKGSGRAGKTSRVVMFGTVRAQNGQPVMAVLDLRPYENGFLVTDMQKVNSSYTKKNPADFISSSEVLYADEKRAAPLLRLTGLTLTSQQLLQNGSVGSISYAGQDVNIEGTPFFDMTDRRQFSTGRGLNDMAAEQAGENNNSPAQDAVYGRQRAGGTDIPLGVSATQESSTIVSRTGENSNPLSEILRGTKKGRVDAGEAMQKIGGEELARALDTGEYAADADGMLYRVKPEEHIDQRASYQVGSRKMNAFQFDHPELHPYYAEAAGELLYELDNAQPGGEVIELPGNEPPFESRYIRTSRVATDRIAYLLDDQRLSYTDIEKALHAIVEDRGQENFAAAKRVELVLDNMLTNGYRAIYGENVAPNAEYIRLKQDIPGAEGHQTLQAPRLTTYEQREAERRANEATDRVNRLVNQIDDLTSAVERQAPTPAAEATPENTARSDYMDALARDENVFTSDAYTLADRLYDLQLRRAQQQEAPPERPAEQVAQEDLDELAGMFTDQGNFFASREDRIRDTENMVADHTVTVDKTRREKASEAWSYFYRKMVDAGHSVSKFAEAAGDPYLYQIYNQARASSSAGVSMITDAQTNVNAQKVGESLNGIFSPIRAKGEDYYRTFQTYLFDLHNIDRMSLSQNKEAAVLEATAALNEFDANHPEMRTSTEAQLARMTENLDPDVAELAQEKMRLLRNVNRADAIKDKPVFSFDVTADVSRERARRAAQEHPEFEEYRQKVRTYIDNLMQYRVDSGLMTQADADYLKRLYPNYVPTMRVGADQAGAGRDRNAVRVGRTVGRAEGGTANLVPLHEALGRQTMKVVREGSKNRFGQRLLDDFVRVGENSKAARYVQEAHEYEHEFAPDTLDDMSQEQLTKDKTLTVFKDGKLWELTVDDTMFDALKALSPDATESNAVTRAVRTANNLFKALVTGYNPTFTIRNTVRDLQTAGLYTRDAAAFARNYPKALAEIKNNGEYWQMYKALGGSFSSVFDYNTGTVKEPKGKTAKLLAKVEALNMTMEQAPRLAEFMSVVEKGGTSTENLADALYAAADVTVNFGRAGTLGKVLNANYVPFLNPGIQGFDKLIRRVTETKGGREWAKLIVRAAALGVAPTLLNSLLYHDDDEWDDLRDSDKDTNYLFKLGNGTWLKIPKGRELSLLGITADRIGDALRGEKVDLIATINTMGNQVAPANPLTSNIASALFEAQLFDPSSPGRTWYGGDIENQRLQSYAPGQRYDSSTDIFSKAVGGALGISPKKLNYVLDQYSGVVGDFLLPLLTPQAERDPFSKAFTVDAVNSNRLSGDFYDEADALTYAKNGGDATAGVVSRFWSKQQSACGDLYKQIRDVEASDLSDKEKRQKTRELRAVINGIQKNAMAVEDTYRAAVEKNLGKGMSADDAYRAANKECFGAEYALQVYSKDVYEKAKSARSNGVSYDDYYTYYFGTKGLKATDDTSVTTQKFDWLQSSGMSVSAQAEIYFADMASDKVLQTQAELEISSGITAEQFYQYKVASSGMTRKAEKMQAINSLDLTSAQKDAIYYAEGWAQSTIGQAPWRGGYSGGYSGGYASSRGGEYFSDGGGYERALAALRRRGNEGQPQIAQATESDGYYRALEALRARQAGR